MSPTITLLFLFLALLLLYLYIHLNDAKLMKLPHEVALAFSPHRISARDALEAAAKSETTSLDSKMFLPPKTGRRYIVVGGVCQPSLAQVTCPLTWTLSGRLSRWLDCTPFARARRAPKADQSPGHTCPHTTRPDNRLGQGRRLSSRRHL